MYRTLVVDEKTAEKLVKQGWEVFDYKWVGSVYKVVVRKPI